MRRLLFGLLLASSALAAACSLERGGTGAATSIDGGDESDAESRDALGAPVADAADDETTDASSDGDIDAELDAGVDSGSDTVDAARDASGDVGDAAGDAPADGGVPGTIVAAAVVGTTLDKVSGSDQGLSGDGNADGTFSITIVGPVDGLILVTTTGAGAPSGGSQWDTLVANDTLPSIGTSFTKGSQTWVLGVYEGVTRLNDANGRIAIGAGVHALTLYASNNGSQVSGQHFRVYAHATGGGSAWPAGPVVKW